jgi:hypothetical protein
MTLHNNAHFFHPNPLKRYSLGTKNKNLKKGADGTDRPLLTLRARQLGTARHPRRLVEAARDSESVTASFEAGVEAMREGRKAM